ncbi:MAG: YabP/YqfC family sporulation protein [bacterium]|nr:YabP/YqfC family sporulation protein [bacterium]
MSRRLKSSHKKYKKTQGKKIYKQFEDREKQEKEREKRSLTESISSSLDLPADIIASAPILTATGKTHITLENYKSILEYNGNLIRVQTKSCRISIEGKRLNIDYFTNEEMRISGLIELIRYN